MPTKSKPKSGEGSDQPENDSVYDFLYHDARRVGSFLGQFDPDGHLQGLQTNAATGRARGSKTTGGGTGGVPLVASATASHEQNEGQHWDRNAQRTFDPLWGNALAFLDYLTQRDLIVRDVASAGIGQFVLASGDLAVIDLRLLKEAWTTKSVRDLVSKGTQTTPDPKLGERERQAVIKDAKQNAALMFDLLPILPHVAQANIATGQHSVWCTLSDEAMVTSSTALALRSGVMVSGTWHMLGILDAKPNADGDQVFPEFGVTADQMKSAIAFGSSPLGMAAISFQPLIRFLMGRPPGSFAMTPILIFREIAGG